MAMRADESTNGELPRFLRVTEFAAAVRVSRNVAYAWVRSHPDRVVKIGSQYRVPRRVVLEMARETAGSEPSDPDA